MRKVVVKKPGGYDRLNLESAPDPRPESGEVLVRTSAIGVNYADCVVRMGLYAPAKKYVGWPITPGFDFAGTVLETGDGANDLAVGDKVVGVTRFGGYATHVVVPKSQLFPLPAGFSLIEAAGFPTAHLTAYYALFELAHVRPEEVLLVHSAAGGVGSAMLRLAKIAGCRTIAVVGAKHKVAAARSGQASEVIDKTEVPLWSEVRRLAPQGCQVVLDANGASTLAQSYRHLAPGGRLVVYGFHSMLPRRKGRPSWVKLAYTYLRTPRFNPLSMTGTNRSVLAFNLSHLFYHQDLLRQAMDKLLAWAAAGVLGPSATTTYPLDQVAQAHRDLQSGSTVGKLVLLP